MLRFVFISALVAVVLAFSKPLPRLDGRIVGGENAYIEDHPYQVSLLSKGLHNCGGSIISSVYIVTVAHCTDGTMVSDLSIRAGSSIRNQGGVVVQVSEVHQHPEYDPFTLDFDISVLRLANALIFGSGIDPIRLPNHNQIIPVGSNANCSGWGALSEGGSHANQLQVVTVQTVSNSACNDAYGGVITVRMMCAGVIDGGKDACTGDSGGPLIVNKQLTGIVSFGYGCGRRGYPGVYASVPNLREFIAKITGI